MKSCLDRLAILLLCLTVGPALAQEPVISKPSGEGSITGRVVSLDGQPMAGAQISLTPEGKKRLMFSPTGVLADEEGHFKINGLGRGVYRLRVYSPGYVDAVDAVRPSWFRAGDNATIRMEKGGVITGRVLDETGEPMVGVYAVPVWVRGLDAASPSPVRSTPVGRFGRQGGASTDDRGVYRIYGLEPGVYIVKVSGAFIPYAGSWMGSQAAPTYYPSASRTGATEISLNHGQEISGVDIQCRMIRGFSLSGSVAGESVNTGIFNEITLKLLSVPDRQSVAPPSFVREGNFLINGLEDGAYDLILTKLSENYGLEIAGPRRVVIKGGDQSGITLRMEKLASIAGRVVVEPAKAPDACKPHISSTVQDILLSTTRDGWAKSLLIETLERDGFPFPLGSASPDEKGEFLLDNLEAGRVRMLIDLPGELWHLRSLGRKSGTTITPLAQTGLTLKSGERISGVEAVVAQNGASLKGKVVPLQEGGTLPSKSQLLLLPVTTAAADDVLQYADILIGADGEFEFQHLPPGKYWALLKPVDAVVSHPADWDPALRAKLRKEAENQKVEIELKPCQRLANQTLRLTASNPR